MLLRAWIIGLIMSSPLWASGYLLIDPSQDQLDASIALLPQDREKVVLSSRYLNYSSSDCLVIPSPLRLRQQTLEALFLTQESLDKVVLFISKQDVTDSDRMLSLLREVKLITHHLQERIVVVH